MKMLVICCGSYEQEVEADDFFSAVSAAFAIKLPLSIGEVVGVRPENPKKKKGWDSASYVWTAHLLKRSGQTAFISPAKEASF
jgi:hypothetical protein